MTSEIDELRRAFADTQLRLEEERQRREEEQRGRQEAQERAEEERRGREEERRGREEERRGREEERRGREEERRAREAAEEYIQGTTLTEFLQQCHDLCKSIEVVTDKSMTTRGDVTNPANRLYPKHILPWTEFPAMQAGVWDDIGKQAAFAVSHHFPSRSDFAYERGRLAPISSEPSLRRSETLTVENMVSDLFKRASQDDETRRALGLSGSLEFQDHTNLGDAGNAELARSMQSLRLQQNIKRTAREQSPYRHRGTADEFCILKSDRDGTKRPIVAIEYKAPHKLTLHTVSTGLRASINTHRDVISRGEEPTDEVGKDRWWCRYVMSAVITQLFSYMVTQDTRYGYISTGQAYVFLRIGDSPQDVYYSVHIPTLDFNTQDDYRLYHTTVARVFAFTVVAAREAAPAQIWQQQAHLLSPWTFDLQSVFLDMPESIRTNTDHSEYAPARTPVLRRSPIRTRRFCQSEAPITTPQRSGSEDDDHGPTQPDSPSEQRQARQERARGLKISRRGGRARGSGTQRAPFVKAGTSSDRAYCSHACLRALTEGGDIHPGCPNASSHGFQHPRLARFRSMIRQQLAHNVDATCKPLHIHGARGGLLRVSLEPLGYTFVAKGTERHNRQHLRRERQIYRDLSDLQGVHIPVCMGMMDLVQPYYYSGATMSHVLFLSWGGYPLTAPANESHRHLFEALADEALTAIHAKGFLHNDAEGRNILFNPRDGSLMIIDLERACQPTKGVLSDLSTNDRSRMCLQGKVRGNRLMFERERTSMRGCLAH